MLTDVHLRNFGPFSDLRWKEHGAINVVVGENDTGKSYLLRVMYAFAKSVEELSTKPAGAAAESPSFDNLPSKLRWCLQPVGGLGTLIRDGADAMSIQVGLADKTYGCVLRKGTRPLKGKRVLEIDPQGFQELPRAEVSTIFLPPKEVLTIFAAIEISRSKYEIYGFDDTYYDLLKLLRVPPTQGEIDPRMGAIVDELERFVDGTIVRRGLSDDFVFQRGTRTYGMPQTADGIKKIGVLALLIKNRSIKPGTILFLDEPETNLHPRAIAIFTNVLFRLAQAGVQVYLATHSYFVLKQLEILAKRHETDVPVCSLSRAGSAVEARFADLREGMPEGPIIEESLRLYQEGIDVDMKR